MGGSGPFGEASGPPVAIAVENFRMLRNRQTADAGVDHEAPRARINLLNWDGKGRPEGLFPPRKETTENGSTGPEGDAR
jgi:nitrate reductase / nitrite oxidoreductase, beta subunit